MGKNIQDVFSLRHVSRWHVHLRKKNVSGTNNGEKIGSTKSELVRKRGSAILCNRYLTSQLRLPKIYELNVSVKYMFLLSYLFDSSLQKNKVVILPNTKLVQNDPPPRSLFPYQLALLALVRGRAAIYDEYRAIPAPPRP